MLALRQLFANGRRGDEQDTRPVEEVFDASSERLGEPCQPAVVHNLAAHGIKWAWQLGELNDANWDALSVPIGLQTAVRAELAHPTNITVKVEHAGELNERKRRFLLMPDANGQPAKSLEDMSAMFLGLLATPIAERQNLMLMLCEIMALVSGLFLPISLSFRRGTPAPAAAKGWDVAPTLEDGMDALMLVIFMCNAVVALMSVCLALVIAAGGYHADDRFCEGAMSILGVLFTGFISFVLTPLPILVAWHVLTDAASPYPAICSVVFFWVFYHGFLAMFFKFGLEHTALENFHLPWMFRWEVKALAPWLKHLCDEEVLRPKAEARAAKLRAQLGATHGTH